MQKRFQPSSTVPYDNFFNGNDRCEPKHEQQRVLRRAQSNLSLATADGYKILFVLGSIPSSIVVRCRTVVPVVPRCFVPSYPVVSYPKGSVVPRTVVPSYPQENVVPSGAC